MQNVLLKKGNSLQIKCVFLDNSFANSCSNILYYSFYLQMVSPILSQPFVSLVSICLKCIASIKFTKVNEVNIESTFFVLLSVEYMPKTISKMCFFLNILNIKVIDQQISKII